jgi:hypothetical protein
MRLTFTEAVVLLSNEIGDSENSQNDQKNYDTQQLRAYIE